MESLVSVLSSIKSEFFSLINNNLISKQYGIENCDENKFENINSLKLEITFIENIDYLTLSNKELNRIKIRSYKNLFDTINVTVTTI